MEKVENTELNVEDLLSKAIIEADKQVAEADPGSEERERLVRERDLLVKALLEVQKQNFELSERWDFTYGKESKWKKVGEIITTGLRIAGDIFKIGGSLAIAVGIISLGHKQDYLSADDVKGLSMVERLLTR